MTQSAIEQAHWPNDERVGRIVAISYAINHHYGIHSEAAIRPDMKIGLYIDGERLLVFEPSDFEIHSAELTLRVVGQLQAWGYKTQSYVFVEGR